MNKAFFALLIAGLLIVPFGSFVIYAIESTNENSNILTLLDAFWWSGVTITTVGYGNVVPVTDLGKIFALFYMFSGIAIAGVFLTLLTDRFYKKRIMKEDESISYVQKQILKRIDDLEKMIREIRDNAEK